MLDGRVLEASQVEYKPFGKPPLQREVRPRSGLLQEPCLHAPEGRRGSHLFEQLRRFEISIIEKARKRELVCACARSRRAAPPAGGELFSALPSSRSLSMILLRLYPLAALQLHTALSFAEELPIELRDEMPLVRALGLEQRVLAGPLALHVAGRPLGHQSSRDAERPRPPTQRASPGVMPARTGRPQRKSSL